jgi:hypothetical protein
MWGDELERCARLMPCPAEAYAHPREWLADTPLMRALLALAAARGLPRTDVVAVTDAEGR